MDCIHVNKISLQWIDDETLQQINTSIQNNKTFMRMQVDVTDSANQYQRSKGNISRQRSFVASMDMKDIPQHKHKEKLMELQMRIFDQNFTYNEVHTSFKLQFFEPNTEQFQEQDLMNIKIQ